MAEIVKKIHYCWFGNNEKPEIVKKCIETWKNVLPEYELIEWNESNFDVNSLPYTKQAYEAKKYAFVSDYARLIVLKEFGGIYLDTDVEVLKPLEPFLENEMFCGFENDDGVNSGLILGCVKGHPFLDELTDYYLNHDFLDENGEQNTYTTVQNMTDRLVKYGLVLDSSLRQTVHHVTIYPKITFAPDKQTRESGTYSADTYTVHHYTASWRKESFNQKLKHPVWRLVFHAIAGLGKFARAVLGDKNWIFLRDKLFRKLYNFARGI